MSRRLWLSKKWNYLSPMIGLESTGKSRSVELEELMVIAVLLGRILGMVWGKNLYWRPTVTIKWPAASIWSVAYWDDESSVLTWSISGPQSLTLQCLRMKHVLPNIFLTAISIPNTRVQSWLWISQTNLSSKFHLLQIGPILLIAGVVDEAQTLELQQWTWLDIGD